MSKEFLEWRDQKDLGSESPSSEVIEIDDEKGLQIREFEFQNFSKPGTQDYGDVKKRLGSLAITDAEHESKNIKDRRFFLNPYTKKSLSIQNEELRAIESSVQDQIQKRIEQSKVEASRLGFEEGFTQGLAQGLQEFKAQSVDKLTQIENFLNQAESAKMDLYKANEKFIIQLVYRLAKMVLLKELKEDRAHIGRLIESLIRETRAREYIIVRVNPQDLEAVSLIKPELKASFSQLSNIKVESTGDVPVGGCQIETEWTQIETDINLQLKTIEQNLLGGGS
jgi:flagellar biosynthesis/type III secretory pathway protein FliH